MTTIKLKVGTKNSTTLYKAGQCFRSDKRKGLLVLCRPEYGALALTGIEEDYAYYYADKSRWVQKDEATLSELEFAFKTDLTPISVTISED